MRVQEYEVPIDDRWHSVWTVGDPVAVRSMSSPTVELVRFWALDVGRAAELRLFRVFKTGQEVTSDGLTESLTGRWYMVYRGTTSLGRWHLFEATELAEGVDY